SRTSTYGQLSFFRTFILAEGIVPFFFFSSRRRHTRWPRDWSSDVCSSDLIMTGAPVPEGADSVIRVEDTDRGSDVVAIRDARDRSEERRIGKECRSRWSPYH